MCKWMYEWRHKRFMTSRFYCCCKNAKETDWILTPKYVSDIKADDTILNITSVWKIYYSHNDIFWAEQGNPLKLVQKCERTGKRDWLGVFMWLRGDTGGKVLGNFLLAPKEAILGLYQFVRCGTEKQKGWVRLKKLSAVKNFKNGFWLFITLVH